MSETELSPGDPWTEHYRGLVLHLNAKEEVWWQQYNGEQRLHLSDPPNDLVSKLLDLKPNGARFRVTEHNEVIAKEEDEDEDTYEPVYVGRLDDHQQLYPDGEAEFAIDLQPDGVEAGDLWPSVYDGARYSLTQPDQIWWHNPNTKRRHPVTGGISTEIANELLLRKRNGGSFRVTPWGDVITLIETVPEPEAVKAQFAELPRIVQNIIQLRSNRGLDMLPVYLGNIGDAEITVETPRDLTAELSEAAQQDIEAWIESLGPTTAAKDGIETRDEATEFDDDPAEWATTDLEREPNDD